jgi:YgiT-type zinc finger domain-containing protein
VAEVIRGGEVIETEPDSYLMMEKVHGRPLHVVASLEEKTRTCIVITVYYPDPDIWGPQLSRTKNQMNCTICKTGEMHPGKTTVMVERDRTVVIVREVPALICDNCGEYYLDNPVATRAATIVDNAVKNGAEVEVVRFAA